MLAEIVLHVADKVKSDLCNYKCVTEKFYPEFYNCISDISKIFGLDNRNCNQLLEFKSENSGVKIKQDVVFLKHIYQDLIEKNKYSLLSCRYNLFNNKKVALLQKINEEKRRK